MENTPVDRTRKFEERQVHMGGRLMANVVRLRLQMDEFMRTEPTTVQIQAFYQNTRVSTELGQTIGDVEWILAMRKARLPLMTILKVWDIKNDPESKLTDPTQ